MSSPSSSKNQKDTETKKSNSSSKEEGEEDKKEKKEKEEEDKKKEGNAQENLHAFVADQEKKEQEKEDAKPDHEVFLEEFPEESEQEQLESLREHFLDVSYRAKSIHLLFQGTMVLPPSDKFFSRKYLKQEKKQEKTELDLEEEKEKQERELEKEKKKENIPSTSNNNEQNAVVETPGRQRGDDNDSDDAAAGIIPLLAKTPRKGEGRNQQENQMDVSPTPASTSSTSAVVPFSSPSPIHVSSSSSSALVAVSPSPSASARFRHQYQQQLASIHGPSPIRLQVFNPSKRMQFDFWMQEEHEFTRLCFFKYEDILRCQIRRVEREIFTGLVVDTLKMKMLDLEREETNIRFFNIGSEIDLAWLELVEEFFADHLITKRKEWILRLCGTKIFLTLWPPCYDKTLQIFKREENQFQPMLKWFDEELFRIKTSPTSRFWFASEKEQEQEGEEIIITQGNNRSRKLAIMTKPSSLRQEELEFRHEAQRFDLFSFESRQRSLFKENHTRESNLLWSELISSQELQARKEFQQVAIEDLVVSRHSARDEADRANFFDTEWRYRNKWEAIAKSQRTELITFEDSEWAKCLNHAVIVHTFTGMAEARLARVEFLKRAGHVVWLFMKSRREVLRVQNKRRNLARFFQRCGRGYLSRKISCLDRLVMLDKKAEALSRLKKRLSMLLTREVRAKTGRAQSYAIQISTLVRSMLMWRKSCILVNIKYNTRLAHPHGQILRDFISAMLSERKVTEMRRQHSARVLQRSISGFRRRQNTTLASLAVSNMIFFQSARFVRARKISFSLRMLHLFSKARLQLRAESDRLHANRIRCTFLLQRVGRGMVARQGEMEPSHLYSVQEQLYASLLISRWMRRCCARGKANVARVRDLKLARQNFNSNADRFLDSEVPRLAQTRMSCWWRMTSARRKYCAWIISRCFVQRRMRCQTAFLKVLYSRSITGFVEKERESNKQKKKIKGSNSNNNNNNNTSRSSSSTSSTSPQKHRYVDSTTTTEENSIYVVNPKIEEEEDEEEQEEEAKIFYEVGGGFNFEKNDQDEEEQGEQDHLSRRTADLLELEVLNSQASLAEECVSSYRLLQIQFRYERHEANFQTFQRRLKHVQREESACRHRIDRANVEWSVALTRFQQFLDATARDAFRYYFIPFEKLEQREEEERFENERRKILGRLAVIPHVPPSVHLLNSERIGRPLTEGEEREKRILWKRRHGEYSQQEEQEEEEEEEEEGEGQKKKKKKRKMSTALTNAAVASVSDRLKERRLKKRGDEDEQQESRGGILVSISDQNELRTSTILPQQQQQQQFPSSTKRKNNRRPLSAVVPTSSSAAELLLRQVEGEDNSAEAKFDKLIPPREWLKTRRKRNSVVPSPESFTGLPSNFTPVRSASELAATAAAAASSSSTTAGGGGATRPLSASTATSESYFSSSVFPSDNVVTSSSASASAATMKKTGNQEDDEQAADEVPILQPASLAIKTRRRSFFLDDEIIKQTAPEKLNPPSGKHFEMYPVGIFDVCRWFGQNIGTVSATSAPRTSPFGNASILELCKEISRTKPIEVLAMASPWFPFNGGAIADMLYATFNENKKNLRKVIVRTEEDKLFVERMLRRERIHDVVDVVVQ